MKNLDFLHFHNWSGKGYSSQGSIFSRRNKTRRLFPFPINCGILQWHPRREQILRKSFKRGLTYVDRSKWWEGRKRVSSENTLSSVRPFLRDQRRRSATRREEKQWDNRGDATKSHRAIRSLITVFNTISTIVSAPPRTEEDILILCSGGRCPFRAE